MLPSLRFGLGLLLLGINKQIDLQSLLTVEGRRLAEGEGWFSQRRMVQGLFVLALGGIALLTASVLVKRSKDWSRAARSALVGLALIALFVLVRAALFYHLNLPRDLIRFARTGAEFIELLGILIVSASATAFHSGYYGERMKEHAPRCH